MASRVVLTLIGLVGGWFAGAYTYFGIAMLLDADQPGGIHVGAFLLGFVGMTACGFAAWHFSERLDN